MRRSPVRAILLVSTIAASAAAHITLDQPPARDPAMKTPPCGGTNPRSPMPAVFAPGAKVTVKWHETVPHPGFFRIAFSTDGKTFPTDPTDPPAAVAAPVLAIIPKVAGTTAYSTDITLPSAPCETCTIQVIQYMEQHAPPPYYYQCADIVIRNGTGGASNGGSAGASGGNTATGGTGGATVTGSGGTAGSIGGGGSGGTTTMVDAGASTSSDSSSSCAVSSRAHGRAPGGWGIGGLCVGGALLRRRTSRRSRG